MSGRRSPDVPVPRVISHRTNMGTRPENSLAGIAAALADRADAVEFDVRASRDGVPLLLHDPTLARTYADARPLASLTAREAGVLGVPALAAALTAAAGRLVACIEVKERDLGRAVARAVVEAGAQERCWIWAFDPATAAECADALPAVPLALNAGPGSGIAFRYGDPVEEAVRLGLAGVSLDHRLVTPSTVERAHARGLVVFTWTVDDAREIERVAEAGVDGVCGNFPARIRAVLEGGRER